MVSEINDRLIKFYGRDDAGRPNYRLVFADSQLETRHGVFADYYGKIFLREYVGIREVKKYQNIATGCWILEKLIHGNFPGLVNNYSYEPIWVFRDKTGKPVQPHWWAVEMLMHQLLFGKSTLPSEEEEDRKYIEYVESMIDTSPTESLLQSGEGIVVPRNFEGIK